MESSSDDPKPLRVKPGPRFVQPLLFDVEPDREFTTNGSARTHYGKVVEEAVCALFRLTPIVHSGKWDVVYDAVGPAGEHYEIKSLHRTNKLPIYIWRIEKDEKVTQAPIYAIALHRVRGARSLAECRKKLSETMDTLVLLRHRTVVDLCAGKPVRQVVKPNRNSRMGYERAGYCRGYVNISVGEIVGRAPHLRGEAFAEVYGNPYRVRVVSDTPG